MNPFLLFLLLATLCFSQNLSDFIVIDQFGYREQAKKTAVIRAPQIGYDAPSSYVPGAEFQIIDDVSGEVAFSDAPTAFNSGQTDAASGDKIWYFDFSSVTKPGRYYVLDKTNDLRSFSFSIANDVYNNVLKAAVKMFYYQRAGTNKPKEYAGETWADGFNFSQDAQSRDFFDSTNLAKVRDLSGGWFDAGDYNKYTKWTADYVENLLLTFEENPDAFTDDYGIPESGNGIPDILDEVKWGIAWLLKMQNEDGSLLSVQGLSGGKSPPSTVTGRSYYGPPNTVATFGTAKALATAARIFGARGEIDYAQKLKEAALKAWNWGEANPNVIFHNNCGEDWDKDLCPDYDSRGLAAGDQEAVDSWDRVENRISAALALYELTGEEIYLQIFEDNWTEFPLSAWGAIMQQYRYQQHMLLIRYLASSYGKSNIKSAIRSLFTTAFAKSISNSNHFGEAFKSDGYRSYIYDYQWGSNKIKADHGLTYYKWNIVDPSKDYKDAAEDYLHYIHGVNPFNMVYLTSMKDYGASKNVTVIWHDWFPENITPAPGYMPGGPNENYSRDECCNTSCTWPNLDAMCQMDVPLSDPPTKMYRNFNAGWPANSWEVTEPSNGYQTSYIALLSKFVEKKGITPVKKQNNVQNFKVVQNKNSLQIFGGQSLQVSIYSPNGKLLLREHGNGTLNVNLQRFPSGVYIARISDGSIKENRLIAR
ncbi:MAG: glycoside hydrolase family 9 protein [Fibromonadaceae bacterium]|jgi:hypothetical protein|nr:glycoside hydrolase family 9 protein [Fibromonadaceae bacterium]